MTRRLIVNADDFGRSEPINAGIIRAHVDGIVTSTSMMVRWPAAEEAARLSEQHPRLAVGLHLDFAESVMRNWEWEFVYQVVDLGDEQALREEAAAQVARFRELMGRYPTHLDSHQHVHTGEEPAVVARELAAELRVPLRALPGRSPMHCGRFYGRTREGEAFPEGISVETLMGIIRELPLGTTELSCHPGEAGVADATYATEREREVTTLTDPRVRGCLDARGVELVSFADLPNYWPAWRTNA